MISIPQAIKLAGELHKGHVDKAGYPYFDHLSRVFLAVQALDEETQIAALFHDSVEDGKATAVELANYGLSLRSVAMVIALSRVAGVDGQKPAYLDYIRSIAAHHDESVLRIKVADLEDNMMPSRLAKLPADKAMSLRNRYEKARSILLSALFERPGSSWFVQEMGVAL